MWLNASFWTDAKKQKFVLVALYVQSIFELSKGLATIKGRGGGATKREGGCACEVLPLRKGGTGKSLSHAEGGGGHKKFWGIFRVYAAA